MNTSRILELLGTTSADKMNTLRKEETFSKCAEESANEMLNAELFGVPVKKVAVVRPVTRTAAQESTRSAKAIRKAAAESARPVASKPIPKFNAKTPVAKEEDEGIETAEVQPTIEDTYRSIIRKLSTFPGSQEVEKEYIDELVDLGLTEEEIALVNEIRLADVPADDAIASDEAVAAEGCKKDKGCKECMQKPAQASEGESQNCSIDGKPVKAQEMVVETGDSKFPEDFEFDEAAFADEYGIDVDTISCIFVPEDPEAQVAEHIEVSFTYEDSTVTLSISADGAVTETVDAEEVESQFSAEFTQIEKEDGTLDDVLILTLIDEASEGEATQSEEDTTAMSEGDVDHVDEDGGSTTDEFVEEPGLDLDPFYSKEHGMKTADKGAHHIYRDGKATESLAARIIRGNK